MCGKMIQAGYTNERSPNTATARAGTGSRPGGGAGANDRGRGRGGSAARPSNRESADQGSFDVDTASAGGK